MRVGWDRISPSLRWLVAGSLVACATNAMAGPVATGQIEITPTETGMTVSAYVRGLSDDSVTVGASLVVVKTDVNGNMRTQQSRTLEISKGQTLRVAQAGISVGSEGVVDIEVMVRHDDTVIHSITHSIQQKVSD